MPAGRAARRSRLESPAARRVADVSRAGCSRRSGHPRRRSTSWTSRIGAAAQGRTSGAGCARPLDGGRRPRVRRFATRSGKRGTAATCSAVRRPSVAAPCPRRPCEFVVLAVACRRRPARSRTKRRSRAYTVISGGPSRVGIASASGVPSVAEPPDTIAYGAGTGTCFLHTPPRGECPIPTRFACTLSGTRGSAAAAAETQGVASLEAPEPRRPPDRRARSRAIQTAAPRATTGSSAGTGDNAHDRRGSRRRLRRRRASSRTTSPPARRRHLAAGPVRTRSPLATEPTRSPTRRGPRR